MMVCPQCHGTGYLQNNNYVEVGNGSMTFTQSKQVPAVTCPTCLGNKYNTGSGT